MRQAEQTTVICNLLMVQAERIETEFGRTGEIALALRKVINEAYRKEAQAQQKVADTAKIPVRVELKVKHARTTLAKFRRWIGAPADREVYAVVKNAIDATERE